MSDTKRRSTPKIRETLIAKYGPDYYQTIGKKGGQKSRGGGFTKENARYYGSIGGKKGGPVTKKQRIDRGLV